MLRRYALALLVALLCVGCSRGEPVGDGSAIARYHDDANGVTCYTVGPSGISCLRDTDR